MCGKNRAPQTFNLNKRSLSGILDLFIDDIGGIFVTIPDPKAFQYMNFLIVLKMGSILVAGKITTK